MESDVVDATEDSLRDDLAAAFDEQPEVAPEKTEETKQEKPRDETGKFAKAQEQAEEPVVEVPVETPVAEVPTITKKAPQSWKPEIKASFDTLSPEIQDEIIRRETDYNKGIQKYAESARYADTVKPVFDKWTPYLSQLQVQPGEAFDRLIQAEYTLRHGSPDQKQQAFSKLASDYGIDLGMQPQQSNVDPNVQHALSRVQQLEQQLMNQQYQQKQEQERKQQAEQASLMTLIEEFSSKPDHPHFETVRDDMSRMLQSGYAETLDDAYDKAVWARPDIRSTLLKDQEAKRINEQANVAKTAKAKAVGLKGSPSGAAVPIAGASIRDDIMAAFETAGGRL